MDFFQILSALTTLAAAFSWVNHRYLRLPPTIGLMAISLLFSLAVAASARFGLGVEADVEQVLASVDFDQTLLHGMLGALLFAGALHVDLGELWQQKGIVSILATLGVLLSTFLVGGFLWVVLGALGTPVGFPFCLVFGAIVSPTDPVAVLGILKQVSVPRTLEIQIAGESLFNDGVGVVVFLALLGLATGRAGEGAAHIGHLFAVEVVGGIGFGVALGIVAYRMLHAIDAYRVEILVTLALVTGGYALAQALHVSGPLAMVVAGLFIGNRGRSFAMSERTRERLDSFWELADEFLNAILFVLIGLEALVLRWSASTLLAGLVAIPIVLAARWASVGLPVLGVLRFRRLDPHVVKVLTWGGLRGGISVALALSLPAGAQRDTLVGATYLVVCFSILVQGLSFGPLLARLYGPAPRHSSAA